LQQFFGKKTQPAIMLQKKYNKASTMKFDWVWVNQVAWRVAVPRA